MAAGHQGWLQTRSQGTGFTCPDKVAVQGVHMDVLTHRLGSSHQGLAHNLTPKEPLGGGYPVMPSSVGRGE